MNTQGFPVKRSTRIAGVTWISTPDDGKADDTTPFEVSRVVIDDETHFARWLTADEMEQLAAFFTAAAMDLREAPVIEQERARSRS